MPIVINGKPFEEKDYLALAHEMEQVLGVERGDADLLEWIQSHWNAFLNATAAEDKWWYDNVWGVVE